MDPIPPLLSDKKWVLAAVSKEDFLDSLICGTCLRVAVIDLAAREDPDDIFAAVVDQCNDCRKGKRLCMDSLKVWLFNVRYVAIDGGLASHNCIKVAYIHDRTYLWGFFYVDREFRVNAICHKHTVLMISKVVLGCPKRIKNLLSNISNRFLFEERETRRALIQ